MKYTSSSKPIVQSIINQLLATGIHNVFIAPGSRNAPLTIAFAQCSEFTCHSIVDERVAGFYALGMARQLNEPVAIVCTSGTAVLNFAPALCEAYYQEVPIVAITADRPSFWIDQEDGQTIRQPNIFANYVKLSTSLPDERDNNSLKTAELMLADALNALRTAPFGPVHINVPLDNPLYEQSEVECLTKSTFEAIHPKVCGLEQLKDLCNNNLRSMILVGTNQPDQEINQLVKQCQNLGFVVVASPLANVDAQQIETPELVLLATPDDQKANLSPDLLITLGGPIVSKQTKMLLRTYKPKFHIDIDENPLQVNTYNCLTHKAIATAKQALLFIVDNNLRADSTFGNSWKNNEATTKTANYCKQIGWCDLSIYPHIFELIDKQNINLHLSNSTPVRFGELFAKAASVNYYANRGTSGIDGCLSTAAGAALASSKTTLIVTGDVGFFYDSNCFYNSHLPANLKVVLISNGRGSIFDLLGNARKTNAEQYFTTPHQFNAQHLCAAFKVDHFSASTHQQLDSIWPKFISNTNCSVLELDTTTVDNEQIFSDFKKYLKA